MLWFCREYRKGTAAVSKARRKPWCSVSSACSYIFGRIYQLVYAEFQNRPSYSHAKGFCRRMTSPQITSHTSRATDTNFALYKQVPAEINVFNDACTKPLAKAPRCLSLVPPRSRSVRHAPALPTAKLEGQKQDSAGGAFENLPTDTAPGRGILALGDGANLIRPGPRITFIYSGAELPPLRK